jgi:putative endonuclease
VTSPQQSTSWRQSATAPFFVGVTSNLLQRIAQHRAGTFGGFTAVHDIKTLVWFEPHPTMESAILREKRLKTWQRAWKLRLIEAGNPTWCDLATDHGFGPL